MVQEISQFSSDRNVVTDATAIEQSIFQKVKSLMAAKGELVMPCIPSLSQQYTQQIEMLLRSLGQVFTPEEMQSLGNVIAGKLQEGFQASPYARLVFSYEPPHPTQGLTHGLRIRVNIETLSTEDKYQRWVQTREGPLFGTYPDAKVMAIASQLGDVRNAVILDVGAGPGRNTLPLAKLGYTVDALELAPVFAEQLQLAAGNLPVNIIQGDVLSSNLSLSPQRYQFIIAAELVSHFRDLAQVKLLLTRLCDALDTNGLMLFSTFLALGDYQPTPLIREVSQVAWSFIITPSELQDCLLGLPLKVVSIESASDYEHAHLPSEAWPPTSWYPNWASGRDLFPTQAQPPMSLQWVLLRKLA